MLIHGGELSLAQAGVGPGSVRQVQPGRDYEICQKAFTFHDSGGGLAPAGPAFTPPRPWRQPGKVRPGRLGPLTRSPGVNPRKIYLGADAVRPRP